MPELTKSARSLLRSTSAAPHAVAVLRSVVIAMVLVISVLQASPSAPLRESQLTVPVNARPIAALSSTLAAVGLSVSSENIRFRVVRASKRLLRLRQLLLQPVKPMLDKLGMNQRWNLFASKGRHAYRLQVEAMQQDQTFHLLYRAHELDTVGLTPRLSFRRLRGIYDSRSAGEARSEYESFTRWLSSSLLSQHPEYLGVRVSMQRLRLGSRSEQTEVLSVDHVSELYRPGTP